MILKSVALSHFRNYSDLYMEFDRGTNILYGDNAQGKTNILESVYVSGTTKSHKGSKDRELIQFGEEEAHIQTIVEKKEKDFQIDMHIKKNRSKGIYLFHLTNYNKILNQRNKLLKDINFKPELKDTLSVWDMQLIDYGKKIIASRKNFVKQLNEISYEIHKKISGEREELFLNYEPDVLEERFEEELIKSRERDLKFGMTSVGPHRDDMCFLIHDIDIRRFGSQGQQRSCALSLKLSEIELVKSSIKETPVLILDDVLSELDSNRQNFLLNSIHDIQTIITCTGLDEFVKNRFEINKVFKVVSGTVKAENSC